MTRGALYLVWKGDCDPEAALHRSITSLQHWHPELEHRVVFMPDGSNLLVKSQMYDLSPFDETLFLDADTTVMGKIDYGFIKMQQHGMALCINANPWQRRYYNMPCLRDDVEYSTGVIFFDKNNAKVKEVFAGWNKNNSMDSASLFRTKDGVRRALYNDQAPFSLAIHEANFNPFVLPMNYNLYPRWQRHWFGEVKVWHGYFDIPAAVMEINKRQCQPGSVIECFGFGDKDRFDPPGAQ